MRKIFFTVTFALAVSACVTNQDGGAVIGGTARAGSVIVDGPFIANSTGVIGGSLDVTGQGVFEGQLSANNGIITNDTDIDAGSGRVTASNIIDEIVAGTNITISSNI